MSTPSGGGLQTQKARRYNPLPVPILMAESKTVGPRVTIDCVMNGYVIWCADKMYVAEGLERLKELIGGVLVAHKILQE